MSIFKESFPKFVRKQLRVREAVIQQGNLVDGSTFNQQEARSLGFKGPNDINIDPGAFFTLTTSKQCVIRMCSGVDVLPASEGGPFGAYVNEPTGVNLAKRFILEGGVRGTDKDNFKPRAGIGNNGIPPGGDNRYQVYQGGGAYGDEYTRSAAQDEFGRGNNAFEDGYGIVPMPGIVDCTINTKSPYGSLREAKVKFICHNRRQLDVLELLYMRPGYPILLEWGWSPFIDNEGSIVEYFPILDEFFESDSTYESLTKIMMERKKSQSGNYDGFLGYCKNFNFKAREDGGYDCTTNIIALGEVLTGLKGNKSANVGLSSEELKNQRYESDQFLSVLSMIKKLSENYSKDVAGGGTGSPKSLFKKQQKDSEGLLPYVVGMDYDSWNPDTDDRNPRYTDFAYGKERASTTYDGYIILRGTMQENIFRLYNLIDPLNKLNTDFLDVNYRASSPNDSESETVIKKILEDFKEFIITPYTKELVGDTTDYPTDGSDENACFVSWDLICDILNFIVIPSTEKAKSNPISKISYTETGSPDSRSEHTETINSGRYKKTIARPTYNAYSKFKLAVNIDIGGADLNSVIDGSIDPSVCIMAHEFYPYINKSNTNYILKDYYPMSTKDSLGYKKIPTPLMKSFPRTGKNKTYPRYRKADGTKGDMVDTAYIPDNNRAIGKIFFNLNYLIEKYDDMKFGKASFNLLSFLKEVWEEDVNEACADTHQFIVFQNSTKTSHEVKVIDLSFDSDYVTDKNDDGDFDLHKFSPFGNKSIMRDFAYTSTLPSALGATIAIAAQAPDNEASLDSVSFSYFNRWTKNRFSTGEDSGEDSTSNKRTIKRLEFASKKENLQDYVVSLGSYKVGDSSNTVRNGMIPLALYGKVDSSNKYGNRRGSTISDGTIKSYIEDLEGLAVDISTRYVTDKVDKDEYVGFKIKDKKVIAPKKSSIIPLKFNAQLDGIGGIVIGNIFNVDESMLPIAYKDQSINFVVMGESQKITAGQDWTTSIHGQLILSNNKKSSEIEVEGGAPSLSLTNPADRNAFLDIKYEANAMNLAKWMYIGSGNKDENNLTCGSKMLKLPIDSICALIGNAIGESGLDPSALEKASSFASPHKGLGEAGLEKGASATFTGGTAAKDYSGMRNKLHAHKKTAEGGVGLFQWTHSRRWRFETDDRLWEFGTATAHPTDLYNCGLKTLGTRLFKHGTGYSKYIDGYGIGGQYTVGYCGLPQGAKLTFVGGGIHGWWMGSGNYGWWNSEMNRKGYMAKLRGAAQKGLWQQQLGLPKAGGGKDNYFNHIFTHLFGSEVTQRDTYAPRKLDKTFSDQSQNDKAKSIINVYTMTYARFLQMWYFVAEEPRYNSNGTKGAVASTFYKKMMNGFVGSTIQDQIDAGVKHIMYENLKPASALCDPDNVNGYKQLAQRDTTTYPTAADVTARVIAKCGSDNDATNRLEALKALDKRQGFAQQTYNTWLRYDGDTLPAGVPWMTPTIGETRHSFDKGYPITYGQH